MVFVVDDDDAIRDSLSLLLRLDDLPVESYDSAQSFLLAYDGSRPGCLLVDVRMPGMTGLELQDHLTARKFPLAVVIMTGHADVSMAVRAMRAGAVDFVEKPFDDVTILEGVKSALRRLPQLRAPLESRAKALARIERLTPRERDVFERLAAGRQNKVIAHDLKISPRTVEIHRARVMEKTGSRSLSDLVRLAIETGIVMNDGA